MKNDGKAQKYYSTSLQAQVADSAGSELGLYSFGTLIFDPVTKDMWFKLTDKLVDELKEYKYPVKGNLLLLRDAIDSSFVDVASIFTSPEFPYGTILDSLSRKLDDNSLLNIIDTLNGFDFQKYLAYYALSRHVTNNDEPMFVMTESVQDSRITLTRKGHVISNSENYTLSFAGRLNNGPYRFYNIEECVLKGGGAVSDEDGCVVGKIDVACSLNYAKQA